MPRWLYGSVVVVYLTGLFGLGLYHQVTGTDSAVGDAMIYGARWPMLILHALNVI